MIVDASLILIPDNPVLDVITKIGLVLALALLSFWAAREVLVRAANAFAAKSKTRFDDYFMEARVFSQLSWLAPAMVVSWGSRFVPQYADMVNLGLQVYTVLVVSLVFAKCLNALDSFYQTLPIASRRPIKGYVQLVKLFVYIIAGVVAVAALLGRSPWGLLSGIGALTAVLLLVFKDTILSLVAGIQIGANDLLRKGDWIEMPAMGADGNVVDVALNTVKVQNWDKTISAIPTYKFIDTSFKNWRGMSEAGGRRIKRALRIDMSSIRFADPELLDRLAKVQYLAPYISERQAEIDAYNQRTGADPSSPLNGRHLSNVGLFRRYALEYLRHHPEVHQDMTLLVRQLQPEAQQGLSLEIYCFTRDTNWDRYEDVQSDIFDHLLTSMPEFGLRAYQRNALVDGRKQP